MSSSPAARVIEGLIPVVLLGGCPGATAVIASATPHAEILEWIDEQDP